MSDVNRFVENERVADGTIVVIDVNEDDDFCIALVWAGPGSRMPGEVFMAAGEPGYQRRILAHPTYMARLKAALHKAGVAGVECPHRNAIEHHRADSAEVECVCPDCGETWERMK